MNSVKNQITQSEINDRAMRDRIRDRIQTEIERKRYEEKSATGFGGREPYQPCKFIDGKLSGTCFPTKKEVEENYLLPDKYIDVSDQ